MSLPPGLINLDHYTAAAQAMSEMDEHKSLSINLLDDFLNPEERQTAKMR